MSANLNKPFSESCCDGGCGPVYRSAEPCGCDPDANWVCERHKHEPKETRQRMGVSMTKVYLAAPWKFKKEAAQARDKFVLNGIHVTSRWIDFVGDSDDPAVLEQEALNDIDDMEDADGMVVLQLEKSEGKAFEQGFFIGGMIGGSRKVILVSPDGSRGNVFQYLSYAYTMVSTVEEAIEEVKKWTL